MFLLVMCLICSAVSVYSVYIAASGMDAAGYNIGAVKCVVVQCLGIFLGIIAFVLFTVVDADILGKNWKILCIINALLLVALILFGEDDGTGNHAWIRFFGIGVQPSEVIKILYIVVLAKHMSYLRETKDINSFWSAAQMAAHMVLVFGAIIVVSSDLGSATIILFIFLVMFFVLGVKLYWFALGGAAVAAMVPLLWTYFLKDYQKKRLIAPYNPLSVDPTGYGITWQTNQSRLALASGRLTGIGPDDRATIFTGKHTDFIFSCIGENFGLIGCLIVIVLLVIIIVHCAKIGLTCGRVYDMLICMGVTAALAWQTFVNIGMCLGITPVIGITLPFFSYGGSSMVTLFAAVGLVSGVKYKPKPQQFVMAF